MLRGQVYMALSSVPVESLNFSGFWNWLKSGVKLFIQNIIKAHQKQWLFQTEQPNCFIKVKFQNERAIHIKERRVLIACWLT